MAKKISELTERLLADLDGNEFFEIIDGTGNYKLKISTLLDMLDGIFTGIADDITALQIYDIGGAWNGTPTASAVILRHIFVRPATFADNFAGAQGKSGVAATGSTVYDIKKNGSSVGTMTWAGAGTVPTFNTTGTTVSFVIGDILEVIAPVTPDATLADITFTLTANRD